MELNQPECALPKQQIVHDRMTFANFEEFVLLRRSLAMSNDPSTAEVANRNPTFGSSLLNDNFGRRQTEDDLDPLQLTRETECSRVQNATANDRSSAEELGQSTSGQQGLLDSLMAQNPNGATQTFTDMHGIPKPLEEGDPLDKPGGCMQMRQMITETTGGQRDGVTDWGTGTDAGQSDKSQVGIAYGTFTGA